MPGLIHEIRRGLITARVRKRKHTFSVTLIRLYRDGDLWKESTRLCPKDIPLARHVLNLAHTWMLQTEDALREGP